MKLLEMPLTRLDKVNILLITLIILFSIIDLFMSWYLIPGYQYEANPFMRQMWKKYGFGGVVMAKFCATFVYLMIAQYFYYRGVQKRLLFINMVSITVLSIVNGMLLYLWISS